MTLDTYLLCLRVKRARLLARARCKRRKAALRAWYDARICKSPYLHPRYWRAINPRFAICDKCAELNEWVVTA